MKGYEYARPHEMKLLKRYSVRERASFDRGAGVSTLSQEIYVNEC